MAGKVIVRFDEAEDTYTPGGLIYVPDTSKHDQDEAVVLAVGPGKYDANGNYSEAPVSIGDRVLSNFVWGKAWRFFDDDGTVHKVVILSWSDIIAKVVG